LFHRTLHLISQNAFKRNLQKVKTVAGATLFGGAERGTDSNAGGIGGMGFFGVARIGVPQLASALQELWSRTGQGFIGKFRKF